MAQNACFAPGTNRLRACSRQATPSCSRREKDRDACRARRTARAAVTDSSGKVSAAGMRSRRLSIALSSASPALRAKPFLTASVRTRSCSELRKTVILDPRFHCRVTAYATEGLALSLSAVRGFCQTFRPNWHLLNKRYKRAQTTCAMSQELWCQAEKLFQEAMRRTSEDRGAYLIRTCGGDPKLRRLVETLISMTHTSAFSGESALNRHPNVRLNRFSIAKQASNDF